MASIAKRHYALELRCEDDGEDAISYREFPVSKIRLLDVTDPTKHTVVKQFSEESELQEYLCNLGEDAPWTFTLSQYSELHLFSQPEELCSSILGMQHLVELNLSGAVDCRKLQYEIKFGEAKSLQILILDSLKLRKLHPSIGRLKSLRVLSLQHNLLIDFPITLRLLRRLESLNVTGNYFRCMPGAVFHLQNLQVLEGLNACPLDNPLRKIQTMKWKQENLKIQWLPPFERPHLEQPESLQEAAIRAAVGLDCWLIPLPERHRRALAECAVTHGLCDHCLRPVRKVTLERESNGYTLQVLLVAFCGVRDVPFSFVACSEKCKNIVVKRLQALQEKLPAQLPNRSTLPSCRFQLKYLEDLYKYPNALETEPMLYSEPRQRCVIV